MTAATTATAPRKITLEVQSASRPDVQHKVVVDRGSVHCSCPGYRYRLDCWHVQEVRPIVTAVTAPSDVPEDPFAGL